MQHTCLCGPGSFAGLKVRNDFPRPLHVHLPTVLTGAHKLEIDKQQYCAQKDVSLDPVCRVWCLPKQLKGSLLSSESISSELEHFIARNIGWAIAITRVYIERWWAGMEIGKMYRRICYDRLEQEWMISGERNEIAIGVVAWDIISHKILT